MKTEPLKLRTGFDTLPTKKFTELILERAIEDKADKIIFELAQDFQITRLTGAKESKSAPASANLYEVTIRILLTATEIQYWTKGEVSAPLETVNPISKWMLESKDLTKRVELRRIRAM